MTLLALLGRCPDALTADFYRFYGDSPQRLLAAGVPLPDVAAMAAHLPPDCAVRRALNPPTADELWTLEAQLLALVFDQLAVISYVQQRQAGGKPSKPKPLPRPGVAPDRDRTTVGGDGALPRDEMAAWLGEQWQQQMTNA